MNIAHALKQRTLVTHLAAFALGALLIFVILKFGANTKKCSRNYDLLDPHRQCNEDLPGQGEWDYEPLREKLLVMLNDFKKTGKLTELSIYFRDLDHGPRFGIGEYDKFHPASLRKVPIMVALLHMADLDPTLLDKKLNFIPGSLTINDNAEESGQTILAGKTYTVRELLQKMIVYSDNYSYELLTRALNAQPPIIPYYTFRDLNLGKMMMDPNGSYISVQIYATIFAVLYNTGYLSKDMSQYALKLLSEAAFHDGLVAGVPSNTPVAHKFAQWIDDQGRELHDCGIVYHPEAAYILCVMTRGSDFSVQKAAIADISRVVYETVSSVPDEFRSTTVSTEK